LDGHVLLVAVEAMRHLSYAQHISLADDSAAANIALGLSVHDIDQKDDQIKLLERG
jgi:hypothetical protein